MANTTRISLVMRLRTGEDTDAWSQFVDIYGPLIYGFGRSKGLQDADAGDLTQEVLREVARSIAHFQYDPNLGRFRSWLYVIARRTMGHLYRGDLRRPAATGDTQTLQRLGQIPADDGDEDVWETEYRRHLFQWASEQIRGEFAETTWNAFWKTAVDGERPTDVAEQLKLSVGSVYVAKSRVIKRLREKIATVDDTLD